MRSQSLVYTSNIPIHNPSERLQTQNFEFFSLVVFAPGTRGVLPNGIEPLPDLELYHKGMLVRRVEGRELLLKYTTRNIFDTIVSEAVPFDKWNLSDKGVLYIKTPVRGPSLFGYNDWYFEEYTIDVSTGHFLSRKVVDRWTPTVWASSLAGVVIGVIVMRAIVSRIKRRVRSAA